jgi:hypothetical protein
LKNLLSHLATDYTVQSCFGKRWFANAVRISQSTRNPPGSSLP